MGCGVGFEAMFWVGICLEGLGIGFRFMGYAKGCGCRLRIEGFRFWVGRWNCIVVRVLSTARVSSPKDFHPVRLKARLGIRVRGTLRH